MNFVTVKMCQQHFKLNTTPEMAEHMRKVESPTDLNEALVSVRHDEMIERMQSIIADEISERFAKMLFPSA